MRNAVSNSSLNNNFFENNIIHWENNKKKIFLGEEEDIDISIFMKKLLVIPLKLSLDLPKLSPNTRHRLIVLFCFAIMLCIFVSKCMYK